jgi:hypothetical protein
MTDPKPVQLKATQLAVFRVTCYCRDCKRGEMLQNGIAKLSHPPQFEHECDQCGYAENYTRKFPLITYKELPNEPRPRKEDPKKLPPDEDPTPPDAPPVPDPGRHRRRPVALEPGAGDLSRLVDETGAPLPPHGQGDKGLDPN